MERRKRLQFRIDAALAALFLAALFALGAATLATDGDGVRSALTARQRVTGFMDDPADAGRWDWFAARIRSLDDYLSDHLCLTGLLGELNARFQYALGKRIVESGGRRLLTLEGGQLYEPQFERVPMEPAAREILALRAQLPAGTPFLFVYEHPGLYEAAQLPAGYEALDRSGEMADELLALLASAQVACVDSREVLTRSGLSPAAYLLRTDSHWAPRAALEMARGVAEETVRRTGLNLRPELLDIANFESRTLPGLFLGTYGQRVGAGNVAPDDITVYWPRYPTNIRRRTNYLGERTDVTGEFRESVIRWRYLRAGEGKNWNTVANHVYGLTENWDYYENPDGADCTILLFKDSFGAAIGSFLSLVADEVCAVDPRRSDRTPREWIDQLRPDIVIAAYSLPYLCNEDK